jgi:hypothetical protein
VPLAAVPCRLQEESLCGHPDSHLSHAERALRRPCIHTRFRAGSASNSPVRSRQEVIPTHRGTTNPWSWPGGWLCLSVPRWDPRASRITPTAPATVSASALRLASTSAIGPPRHARRADRKNWISAYLCTNRCFGSPSPSSRRPSSRPKDGLLA